MDNLPFLVNQDAGRNIAIEGDTVGFALGIDLRMKGFIEAHFLPASDLFPLGESARNKWDESGSGGGLFPVDFMFAIDGFEKFGERADGLGSTEKEKAVGLEGIMKDREHFSLQRAIEINENVAATDQVHVRKRRIIKEILPRENDGVAQALGDAVTAVFFGEKAAEPFGRDIMHKALGVKA